MGGPMGALPLRGCRAGVRCALRGFALPGWVRRPGAGGMKRSPMRRSRKPLPFRSAKRAAIADERRAFVARILSERPQCEARNFLRPIVGTLVGKDQDRVLAALRGCTWK